MSSAYNEILGPMELGNAFNCMLFGVISVQYYHYSGTFKDPFWLRWTMAGVYLLDTVQTAIMIYLVWEYTVTYYDMPQHLLESSWAIGVIPFFSVPIAWVAQWFFAWRLYQLGGQRKLLPAAIIVTSVIQGLAGLGCGIGAFILTSVSDFPKLQPIAGIWFGGSILCDSIITGAMLWYLLSARTGYADTDQLINRIARTVIETGLATTIIVALDAMFFFHFPLTNLHLCVVMIAGKTYSNSTLYMLNSRKAYRKISRAGEGTTLPSFSSRPNFAAGTTSATRGGVFRSNESPRTQGSGGNKSTAVSGKLRTPKNKGGKKQTLTELVFERPRMRSNGEWVIDSSDDEEGAETAAGSGGSGPSSGGTRTRGGSRSKTATTGTYSLTTLDSTGKPVPLSRTQSKDSDSSFQVTASERDKKVTTIDVMSETEVTVEEGGGVALRSVPYTRPEDQDLTPAVHIDEHLLRSPSSGHFHSESAEMKEV